MAKITLKEIQTLLPLNWKCLSTEYKNLDTEMIFQCPELHKVFNTWKKIRQHADCPTCKSSENKQNRNIAASPRRNKSDYRILAFDQSSRVNGWSVFDGQVLRGYGVFVSTQDKPLERIVDVCDWMLSMITNWKPDQVGFEETQYNPQEGMGHDVFKLLSQVMGAAMLNAAREHVKVTTVLIPTWRHHSEVKGNKRPDQKRSAQHIVKQIYDISVTDDEAEAILMGRYYSDTYKKNDEVIIGEWV